MNRRRYASFGCHLAFVLAALVSGSRAVERLEPNKGCYFGFVLPENESISNLSSRLGFVPAVYGRFFEFPLSEGTKGRIAAFLTEVIQNDGIAMLTIEPWNGLGVLNEKQFEEVADLCASWEARGITGILIRFGHEMNGNWYPWGQQPVLYKNTFRLLAEKMHQRTRRTAMLWAPNNGIGYPFGQARPQPGTSEFDALDTDRDRQITSADDMFDPYYPGDEAVDWVGLTVYHWGIHYPWLKNELPPGGSFLGTIRGSYQVSVPDFYERYCGPQHHKPMAIPETAAFYNTARVGEGSELAIKQGWWRQILEAANLLPQLKCVNWFDEFKQETEAQNNWIDWRISANPEIRAAFVSDFRTPNGAEHFYDAPGAQWLFGPFAIAANNLPGILPIRGRVSASVKVKAATACDLVIDLLDANYKWLGGTRVAVSGPEEKISTSFLLNEPLDDRTSYRWSIFLTPAGKDYLSALAWYRGPNPSDDPDRDGASNDAEFTAGTNPRDAQDVFTLGIRVEGEWVELIVPTKSNRKYQLFCTHDFKNWWPVGGTVPGNGDLLRWKQGLEAAALSAYKVQVLR